MCVDSFYFFCFWAKKSPFHREMVLDQHLLHIYTIDMNNAPRNHLTGPAMNAAIPFITGITAGKTLIVSPFCTGCVFICGLVMLFIFRNSNRTGNITALVLLVAAGMYTVTIQRTVERPVTPPEHIFNHEIKAAGTVTSLPQVRYGRTIFTLKCRYINHNGTIYEARGLLGCSIYENVLTLDDGDRIIVRGRIRKSLIPVRPSFTSTAAQIRHGSAEYRLSGASVQPVSEGLSLFGSLRRSMGQLIDRHHFNGYGGLVKAMILGDRSGLSHDMHQSFARAGIAHVLAVSGLHAGILLAAIFWLLTRAGLRPPARLIITAMLMIGYAGICGFRPPVTRTVLMASIALSGTLFQRTKNTENILFAVLLGMAAYDPRSVSGPSLQLSFAAVWAISTFTPPMRHRIKKILPEKGKLHSIRRNIHTLAGVSFIAFIATAPIIVWHFGSLPLLSVPINIFAVPLAGMIVLMSLVSLPLAALGNITAPLTGIWTTLTGYAAFLLDILARMVSSLPFASVDIGGGALFAGTVIAVWLYVLSRSRGRCHFQKLLVYIPLCTLLVITWHPLIGQSASGRGTGSIVFFDVGQGDSTLIQTSSGQRLLIDTGTAYAARTVVIPSLQNLRIDRLDCLFLSHLDSDHAGGLTDILEHISVDRIFCREEIRDSLSVLYGQCIEGIAAGDSIQFPGGGCAILSPPEQTGNQINSLFDSENDKSLLMRCSFPACSILFTGDLSGGTQELLSSWDSALQSDILKTPHHGAGDFNRHFIETTDPDIAVISCGLNNRYGHPAERTITLLHQSNALVWRTDQNGTLLISVPSLQFFPQ